MTEYDACPHCALPLPDHGPLSGVTKEFERLQAIAREQVDGAQSRRIDELTREVEQLRATVARLRGASSAAPVR